LINSQLKQGKSRKRVVQYQNHIVINSNCCGNCKFWFRIINFCISKKNLKGDELNHSKKKI